MPFLFLELPAELRVMVFEYAFPRGEHMVKRDNLPYLTAIRYRYDHCPRFLQEKCEPEQIIYCEDHDCRDRLPGHVHAVESIHAHDLFGTSHHVREEASRVFFGREQVRPSLFFEGRRQTDNTRAKRDIQLDQKQRFSQEYN